MKSLGLCIVAVLATFFASTTTTASNTESKQAMQLGNFSISLAVKDIKASRAFYEKLGFEVMGGEMTQNWLVLRNGDARIGLFQGMFEENILTFNPGWDKDAKTLESFEDVRALQSRLEAAGLTMVTRADESTTGPASFILADPDGNTIYVDQHVPKPE